MNEQGAVEKVAAGVTGTSIDPFVTRRVVVGPDGRRWLVMHCLGVTYILPDNERHDTDWDDIPATEPTDADHRWLEDYYKRDAGPTDPRK